MLDTLAELGTANIVASTLLGRLQAAEVSHAKTHLMDGWGAPSGQRVQDHAGDFTGRVRLDRGQLDEAIFPQMRRSWPIPLTATLPGWPESSASGFA